MKKLRCMKVTNGEICAIPDEKTLNNIIKDGNYQYSKTTHPNGKRIELSRVNGTWAGTVVIYDDQILWIKEKSTNAP